MALLCISATFLSGTYHGAEWPPSPARLFQGMVAGVMTGQNRSLRDAVAPGLRWLERQPPPEILAADVHKRKGYRLAVPNNDMDVVARAWSAGRPADPMKLKTMKDVNPLLLDEELSPHVRYIWRVREQDGEGEDILARLRPLARCLHTLGWGVDMSFAEADLLSEVASQGLVRWIPGSWGETKLAVPVPGFLDDLDRTYERFRGRATGLGADADTRSGMFRMQAYSQAGRVTRPFQVFGIQALDGDQFHSENWESTVVVAGRMRHAAAATLRAEEFDDSYVRSFVEGHGGDEKNFRMSFVPLPSIGHRHADGRIRRAMFIEPPDSDGSVLRMLAAAIPGQVARDEATGKPVWRFAEITDNKVTEWYTGPGEIWRSVTPVVLHGFNGDRGRISIKKTESLLQRAFEMGGYEADLIDSIRFQAAPFWHNTGAAFKIRLPKHLKKFPRYHIEVRFRRAVTGPVLAGVGRHSGLGVFAQNELRA